MTRSIEFREPAAGQAIGECGPLHYFWLASAVSVTSSAIREGGLPWAGALRCRDGVVVRFVLVANLYALVVSNLRSTTPTIRKPQPVSGPDPPST